MKRLLLLCCLGAAWPAAAAEHADLPPPALVEAALRNHPSVVAARAGVDAGEAQRDQLEAGPHEFTVRYGNFRQREIGNDARMTARELGIERPIRLPGKAAKDAEIGAAAFALARSGYGEALHEAARLLLGTWFNWRREAQAAAEWQAHAKVLREQGEIAAKRVAAGDAARLEALLASAQQTQAEAQLAQAESRLRLAAAELQQHFPALPLPAQAGPSVPRPVEGTFEQWREAILEHSHELRVARNAARRQQLQAQRADAERLPDPTVGVGWKSERDGDERTLGVTVSMALPGAARAALGRAALAEAAAAAAREAQTLARVEGEARRSFEQAVAAYAQWQRLDAIADRIGENTRLLEKAWRLGEGQITDLLTARRQGIDARLAASQARLDAAEARYRLELDTHKLWPLEED